MDLVIHPDHRGLLSINESSLINQMAESRVGENVGWVWKEFNQIERINKSPLSLE